MDRHYISPETEAALVAYVENRKCAYLEDTEFRLNQYRPIDDIRRLIKNKQVAWPYRCTLGVISALFETLLPGRLFGGDHYNPWSNTVHVYSDHPAVLMHEAGHAYDFSKQRYKGTYGLVRILPLVPLWQEFKATDDAIDFMIESGDRRNEIRAYKILYPAYGTYMGRYFIFPLNFAVVLAGHIHGRATAREREKFYQRFDAQQQTSELFESDLLPIITLEDLRLSFEDLNANSASEPDTALHLELASGAAMDPETARP